MTRGPVMLACERREQEMTHQTKTRADVCRYQTSGRGSQSQDLVRLHLGRDTDPSRDLVFIRMFLQHLGSLHMRSDVTPISSSTSPNG
jgi:hypothetical protein